MPTDKPWPPHKGDGMEHVDAADVIFCHQGWPYVEDWYPKDKPTVAIYHSQPHHVNRQAEVDGWPWAVIGQYQTRLYPGCKMVPNLVPLEHRWFRLKSKPEDRVWITYSPTNTRMTGWDDKGFCETRAALRDFDAHIDIVRGRPLCWALGLKAHAHIVIDECATGSYHRSTLEGWALGCVVVNNCDAQCGANIKHMTGGAMHRSVMCDFAHLRSTLATLIAEGPERLAHWGWRNRQWMEEHWSPAKLIERNWRPLIDAAIARAG